MVLFVLFLCTLKHVGSWFPTREPNPCPLQWKREVPTTWLPVNSQYMFCYLFSLLSFQHYEKTTGFELSYKSSAYTQSCETDWVFTITPLQEWVGLNFFFLDHRHIWLVWWFGIWKNRTMNCSPLNPILATISLWLKKKKSLYFGIIKVILN